MDLSRFPFPVDLLAAIPESLVAALISAVRRSRSSAASARAGRALAGLLRRKPLIRLPAIS